MYKIWEETSYRLELRQASPKCVQEEFNGLKHRKGPIYKLSFDPSSPLKPSSRLTSGKKKNNVIRNVFTLDLYIIKKIYIFVQHRG